MRARFEKPSISPLAVPILVGPGNRCLILRGSPRMFRSLFGRVSTRHAQRAVSLLLEQLEERCLLSGDMVLFWNAVAIEAAKRDHAVGAPGLQFGPTRTSRALAIVQGAVFDAVNSIEPKYTPYLIQVAAPPGASIDAAVAEAAHDTLIALYPYQQAFFDSELVWSLEGIPLTRAAEGVAVGATVAQ